VSVVQHDDICFIPLTEAHFTRYLCPWKFPVDIKDCYIKGYFGERKKGASTVLVHCKDFDRSEFSVNVKLINEFGCHKVLYDTWLALTAEHIASFYSGVTPEPSRAVPASESSKKSSKGVIVSNRKRPAISMIAGSLTVDDDDLPELVPIDKVPDLIEDSDDESIYGRR